jgi:hypothetical protein
MDTIKRLLEALRLVRLVWFTHPWKDAATDIVLRIVRYQGPCKQPWCWSAGRWRAILLPNGKGEGKYNCSWEPYNERSPQFEAATINPSSEKEVNFEKEPPPPSSWAN